MTDPHDTRDDESDNGLVAALSHDHRQVEELLTRLQSLPPERAQERNDVAHEIMLALVRHAVIEEAYLYPALRQYAPGGGDIADRALAEHDEIQRVFDRLNGVAAHEPRFDEVIAQAQARLREHVKDEEAQVFPLLVRHTPVAALQRMQLRALGNGRPT